MGNTWNVIFSCLVVFMGLNSSQASNRIYLGTVPGIERNQGIDVYSPETEISPYISARLIRSWYRANLGIPLPPFRSADLFWSDVKRFSEVQKGNTIYPVYRFQNGKLRDSESKIESRYKELIEKINPKVSGFFSHYVGIVAMTNTFYSPLEMYASYKETTKKEESEPVYAIIEKSDLRATPRIGDILIFSANPKLNKRIDQHQLPRDPNTSLLASHLALVVAVENGLVHIVEQGYTNWNGKPFSRTLPLSVFERKIVVGSRPADFEDYRYRGEDLPDAYYLLGWVRLLGVKELQDLQKKPRIWDYPEPKKDLKFTNLSESNKPKLDASNKAKSLFDLRKMILPSQSSLPPSPKGSPKVKSERSPRMKALIEIYDNRPKGENAKGSLIERSRTHDSQIHQSNKEKQRVGEVPRRLSSA